MPRQWLYSGNTNSTDKAFCNVCMFTRKHYTVLLGLRYGVTIVGVAKLVNAHIGNVLKMCSLLKLLRHQGIPRHHLNTVFSAVVLSRIRYTIPAWNGFLSADLQSQVNSFLKRAFKYGFVVDYTIEAIAEDADIDLFCKMTKTHHFTHSLSFLNLVHTTSNPKDTCTL